MILHCSFEELSALASCAERVLAGADRGGVAAPPDVLPDIEALIPRLTGDLEFETLTELNSVYRAVEHVLDDARTRVDEAILDQHPAAEDAVHAYFDFAHILSVHDRICRIGNEMRALAELMTGEPPTEKTARSCTFED